MLTLYGDCAKRKTLPLSGGVYDQPADLLYWFREIDKIFEEKRNSEAEKERSWQTSRRT